MAATDNTPTPAADDPRTRLEHLEEEFATKADSASLAELKHLLEQTRSARHQIDHRGANDE